MRRAVFAPVVVLTVVLAKAVLVKAVLVKVVLVKVVHVRGPVSAVAVLAAGKGVADPVEMAAALVEERVPVRMVVSPLSNDR